MFPKTTEPDPFHVQLPWSVSPGLGPLPDEEDSSPDMPLSRSSSLYAAAKDECGAYFAGLERSADVAPRAAGRAFDGNVLDFCARSAAMNDAKLDAHDLLVAIQLQTFRTGFKLHRDASVGARSSSIDSNNIVVLSFQRTGASER